MPKPVVLYDSGVGGLSLFKEMSDGVYVADNRNFPYGTKTDKDLIPIIARILDYLIKQEYEKIILACNTASAIYIKYLKNIYPKNVLPIIQATVDELENYPSIKSCGVIATDAVHNSGIYGTLIREKYKLEVVSMPGSDLVSLCEDGDKQAIDDYLNQYFLLFIEKRIEALILGCTHFNLIAHKIKAFFHNRIPLILSGDAVIKRFKNLEKITELKTIYLSNYEDAYVERIKSLYPELIDCNFKSLNL